MSLETIMRRLYKSEINFTISVFWDGGFNVSIGDDANGWGSVRNFDVEQLHQVAQWLDAEAKRLYPQSAHAIAPDNR